MSNHDPVQEWYQRWTTVIMILAAAAAFALVMIFVVANAHAQGRGYTWCRGHYTTQCGNRRSVEQWERYSPGLREYRERHSPYCCGLYRGGRAYRERDYRYREEW